MAIDSRSVYQPFPLLEFSRHLKYEPVPCTASFDAKLTDISKSSKRRRFNHLLSLRAADIVKQEAEAKTKENRGAVNNLKEWGEDFGKPPARYVAAEWGLSIVCGVQNDTDIEGKSLELLLIDSNGLELGSNSSPNCCRGTGIRLVFIVGGQVISTSDFLIH